MAAREFSVEFRSAVAQRILNGEKTLTLSRELKIKRSVLYRWRDAYRQGGQEGFKKKLGRPLGTGAKPLSKDAAAGAATERRVAELERRLGRLAMENDFLEKAFKRVKEARSKNNASGEARCTEK